MPTQIFLPVQGGGGPATCQPEFFKIAEHSMHSSIGFEELNKLYYGGRIGDVAAMWSMEGFDYINIAGPIIRRSATPLGIPIPTNLFNGDIIRLTGTAYLNSLLELNNHNYSVKFTYGIYYFDCNGTDQLIPSYVFMPLQTIDVNQEGGNFDGKVCFSNELKLTQKFDFHKTKLLVGFNFLITCNDGPDNCPNTQGDNIGVISFTLDVERPCKVDSTECYVIKNCCEPSITELVFKPGAVIGSFFSDTDGNCWEVMSLSNDVTNYTRQQGEVFESCAACIAINPCPENLVITSCCVDGYELVSGSLPGLNVGDSFVDADGLCWNVDSTGAFPITEESITVSTVYTNCLQCASANPCPVIYSIASCCGDFSEVISSTLNMQIDDVFVDNFGICWNVIDRDLNQLPTNYNIEVVQVHASCTGCTNAHPCPPYYYLTVKLCCDPTRIEVIQIPTAFMGFAEGDIISDAYGMCWEIISYNTNDVATLSFNFPKFSKYPNCEQCLKNFGGGTICTNRFLLQDCFGNQFVSIVSYELDFTTIIFGNYYYDGKNDTCFQVVGYSDAIPTIFSSFKEPGTGNATCDICILRSNSTKIVELQRCDGSPSFIATLQGPWLAGPGETQQLADATVSPQVFECFLLIGLASGTPVATYNPSTNTYIDCTECINNL